MNFKLIYHNVQGCSGIKSLNEVFTNITPLKSNISILGETKSTKEDNIKNDRRLKDRIFNPSTNMGNGMIVINHNNNQQIEEIKQLEGRAIKFRVKQGERSLVILGIYAPASNEDQRQNIWYDEIVKQEWLEEVDIMIGDFNVDRNSSKEINRKLKFATSSHQLKELPTPTPTWGGRKYIDRIFVSERVRSQARLNTVVPSKSDHLILEYTFAFFSPPIIPTRRWSLNTEICKEHSVFSTMQNYLKSKIEALGSGEVSAKWSKMKVEIKKFYKDFERKRITEIEKEKKRLLASLQSNPTQKKAIAERINEIADIQLKDNYVKSSVNKLLYGEVPSKLLTATLKSKERDSQVEALINSRTNTIVTTHTEIVEAAGMFYEDLFKMKPDDPTTHEVLLKSWNPMIQSKILQEIEDPISLDEVTLAIQKISDGKAPGIDGLTSTMYKTHIEVIAPLLSNLFYEWFRNGVPNEFKKGVLIASYKGKGDRSDLSNWRPITLLNVDYKLFSKIINSRLIKLLPSCISRFQTGFVPGRLIQDNLISLKEVIDVINHKKTQNRLPRALITLYDFCKAFDSVSHGAIRRTLIHLKLPTTLVRAIMSMLEGATTQCYIRGTFSKPFSNERGTRQGDPLSPTIFVLVMECMARVILSHPRIGGLPMTEELSNYGVHCRLLSFADDTLTMAKDEKEFEIVDEVIKKFCRATSSSINTDKCVIMAFDSANSKNKKLITNRNLPYPIATAIQSERYLGMFFNSYGVVSQGERLIDNCERLMKLWKTRSSTFRGRMAILKSYILSKMTYHLYIDSFQMDKLEELCKWFLYSSKDWDPTKKNRNKISQARASKSILHGGISLWKMDIRARAQKAWIFTTFINRLNRSSALAVSYEDAWIHRWRNNMPSEFMKNCYEAWKDYTNSKTEIGSKTIPEGTNRRIRLKEIYEIMMKRIDGQREVMILTEGQRKLREENVNLPHILKNLKNCHNNKGRDLMWRYILKALPKVHGSVCPFCKETETSEHIFFTCKRLGFIKNIQERVLSSRYQWNQRILNQINNPVLGSFIAILFDFIWYSRNKKNHDKIDMELNWLAVTYKMNIAKRAEWEKTFGLMSKHWRLHHSTTIDKVKNQCISSIKFQIKMFTKTWCKNNNLIQILIPDHLMALFNVHK